MAAGEQYIDEAKISAKSANKHMPDVETAIATPDTEMDLSVFDKVIKHEAQTETIHGREWLMNSTIPPGLSPFDKTLYLDSDTYICTDVSELFDLLDKFDMAIARNSFKNDIPGLPDPWWEYNCGVIAYTNSSDTRNFLREWKQRYRDFIQEQSKPKDQPAFAHTLYNSDIDFYTLPEEYNVRCDRRGALGRRAKIIHGRHAAGLEQVANELTQQDHLRVFRERSYLFNPVFNIKDRETYRYYVEKTLSEDGPIMTIKRAIAYLKDIYKR